MRAGMLAVLICIGGCQNVPVGVVPSPAPKTLPKVEAQQSPIPEWAMKPLPEDKPREYSTQEAVNLSCRRLNIIKHANCVNELRKVYNQGKPVDPAKCKLDLNKGCNHP